MKTRIIQTRFWDDLFVSEADVYTQHLYIYLLTSQYINISGIFQLPENKIKFEAKLTDKQFEGAKKELEKSKKVFFKDGWVCVRNAEKNNAYRNSPKNETAYQKELSLVPQAILDFFNSSIDTSIDSSMHTNHKSEIINHKSEIQNTKSEKSKKYLENIPPEDVKYFTDNFRITEKQLKAKAHDLLDWCESNGKVKKDYKAFLRVAVRKDFGERTKMPKPPAVNYPELTDEEREANIKKMDEIRKKFKNKSIK